MFFESISFPGALVRNQMSPSLLLKLNMALLSILLLKLYGFAKTLTHLGIRLPASNKVYCGSISTSYMVVNPVQNDYSKYIAVDYHFVHECVVHSNLVVCYIPSKLQLAHTLTKGCLLNCFIFLRIICHFVLPTD